MSSNPSPPPEQHAPQMALPEGLVLEYANIVRIAHSPSELIFDFAHLLPGSPSARITSRILMSPIGAKLFQRALTDNLARYEAAFGEINLPGGSSLAENLFHPTNRDDQ